MYVGSEIIKERDSEKSSTNYTYELIAFDPGNAGYGVSESPIFKKIFRPPYIIRTFGADSPLVSPVTLLLNAQLQKKSIPGQNDTEWYETNMKWYRLSMKTEVWTPKKLYKSRQLPLRKSLSQSSDQNSSWIMNLEENSCRNHESLRHKPQESWISRFKWFRFNPRERSD